MEPPKPKVQFGLTPVVRLEIQGESRGEGRTFNDGGLVGRFLKWGLDTSTYAAFSSSCGGGGYVGYFHPEDAEKVKTWLLENGATAAWD